jgi:hydrogenase-4 component B
MSLIAALLVAFFGLCGVGVGASAVLPVRSNPMALAAIGAIAAGVVLATGAALLAADAGFQWELWPVLSGSSFELAADRLSGVLMLGVGLVYLPVSIFSSAYLRRYAGRYSLRYFGICYHVLFASVVLILVAGDALSFLVAWELMSIFSYLLVTYDLDRAGSAQGGFVMLALGEGGTIAVAVALLLLFVATGSPHFADWRAAPPHLGAGVSWAVFLLSFFGFAVKAGLVPVNSWLPLAHPVAPTNVSALLSAVIVNLGIYGIIRINLDLAPVHGFAPGLIVLVVGSLSALIGILYATIQADMKRLLAHSTIENMGIVAAGIGAAMIFVASDQRVIAGIALIAALYHLVNHAVYKALLFVGAGAVEGGAGSRDLDQLGGLARAMPWTSAFMLVGVLSIAALPPLNGFVSEWLTLQTLLRSAVLASPGVKIIFAVCGALIALTAGLAVTCFAKVYAMGFLGISRSEGAMRAKEANWGVRSPLAILAVCCALLGVLPTYVIPVLDRAASSLVHQTAVQALVPPFFIPAQQRAENLPAKFLGEFHDLGAQVGSGILPGRGLVVLHRGEERNPVVFAMSTSYMAVVLAVLLGLTFVVFKLLTRGSRMTRGAAWDGGLRQLLPSLTYTATGFSNPVRVIFHAVLRPTTVEDSEEAVAQHFRTAITRNHEDVHLIDRMVIQPPLVGLQWLAALVRRMHVGNVNAYAGYVLLTLLVVLVIGLSVLR